MNSIFKFLSSRETRRVLPAMSILQTAFLISLLLMTQQILSAQEYLVKGKVSYDTFMAGQKQFSSRKAFQVAVKDSDWLIRTTDLDHGDTVEVGYEDGTAFRLNVFVKTNGLAQSALIEDLEVPEGDSSLASFLWLAFASSTHLANTTNGTLTPVWILDDPNLRNEKFTMAATWACEAESPHLPTKVTYRNDGVMRAFDFTKKERMVFPAPKPYDQGYLNAEYAALSMTNVADLRIPTKWTFTRYAIPPDARGKTSEQTNGAQNFELVVRSVVAVEDATVEVVGMQTSFRPKFTGTLNYLDRRFAYSNPAVINVLNTMSNGQWPEITASLIRQAKITARATAPALSADASASSLARARRIRLTVAGAVVAISVAFAIHLLSRRNSQQTKSPNP